MMSLDFFSLIKEINSDPSSINPFQRSPGNVYIQRRKKKRTQSTHSRTLQQQHQAKLTNTIKREDYHLTNKFGNHPTTHAYKDMVKVVIKHLYLNRKYFRQKLSVNQNISPSEGEDINMNKQYLQLLNYSIKHHNNSQASHTATAHTKQHNLISI